MNWQKLTQYPTLNGECAERCQTINYVCVVFWHRDQYRLSIFQEDGGRVYCGFHTTSEYAKGFAHGWIVAKCGI